MKDLMILLVATIGLIACKPGVERKSEKINTEIPLSINDIPKIDMHSHYKYSRNYLPSFFKKWNMRAVLVDVPKEHPGGIKRNWNEYVKNSNANNGLYYLCTSMIGADIDNPDFIQKNIARLKQEIQAGAKMMKVWKNFGMVTKDTSGNFIQIDDERLQPIWNYLRDQGISVMAHIGEPVQAWSPLNDPKNPHYGYYTDHPEYHAFQHPEIPSYGTIIAARDRWIEKNPDLQILCAHMGSMSHDVDMIAERLDKYPNIYVEPAARFGDLVGQDSKKVGAFFKKYQDRIFFGTDYGNSRKQSDLSEIEIQEEINYLQTNYDLLWTYLSTQDSVEIRSQKNIGLGLSKEILHKVYYQNAADFLKLETKN
jgi:predicted TIM-barrel fold metal-dependent hydrolase